MKMILALSAFISLSLSATAQENDSIIVSNAVLHYSVQGQGEPILLLSGGPGISSEQLSDISKHLSTTYRCILFDQRGTGRSHTSPLDSTTISLHQAMEDITLLLRRLDAGRITIIGHSWGAMLAMSYAINNPRAVARLVLIGPGPLDMPGNALVEDDITSRASKAEKMFMNEAEDSMAHHTASKELMRAYHKTFTRFLFYDAVKADSLEETIRASLSDAMQELMFRDLARINYDLKAGVSRLNIPLLVVCGRQDPVGLFPTLAIKELNNKATICWIEKSGHFPWVEEPTSFYPKLFNFLK